MCRAKCFEYPGGDLPPPANPQARLSSLRVMFVALSGGRVVDHDKGDETLAARMFRKLGDAPFYIARLEDNPTVYEVPSPELMG